MARATEERTAAVQATEKRIREEAAAAQATLEARALAADNALGLNREDVAKKAAELLELRASAEKHENDAQIAATAAKEQEARAQRAEGQLNAAKEALQTLSVGHMSTSSRVPSLAESEARTARLEATQRLAEAQAKAAHVGLPAASVVDRTSDVRDIIEEAAPPAAAASDSASAADRIAKMAEESADRSRAAAAAQRVQTEKTLNDQVIAARANLERIQEEQSQGIVAPAPPGSGLATAFETRNSAGQPQPRSKLPPPPPSASLLAAHAALRLPLPKASVSRLKKELEDLIRNRKRMMKPAPAEDPVRKKTREHAIAQIDARITEIRAQLPKSAGRRKTSKKRKTRKPRKSTFRRHRKH
jgi:hypothetical protein